MKNNQPVTQKEVPFPPDRYLVSKTDLKGVITYCNDAFINISGFSPDELIGKSHNIVRHPDMPMAQGSFIFSRKQLTRFGLKLPPAIERQARLID